MVRFTSISVFFLSLLGLTVGDGPVPKTDYDVIIVGGGPAGLSAMSALCRVSRRALLFDSKEYRNNVTRNMHDVIGADGAVPHEFRQSVRKQIDLYQLASWSDQKVVTIDYRPQNGYPAFLVTGADKKSYTARRIILATGVTDILPDIKGAENAYGKGMYWCPWCDGFEHRGQPLAVLGPFSDSLSSVVEMHNINPKAFVLTDGTDTPKEREILTGRSATWKEQFKAYNVPIINNTITNIQRLQDDDDYRKKHPHLANDQQQTLADDPSIPPQDPTAGPNGKHHDIFRFHFKKRAHIDVQAILLNCPVKQTSQLYMQMNLKMDASNKVVVDAKTITSTDGVFAVGDMNNEGATNVPHAMYNGKKAAVVVHVQLAKEESKASITTKRSKRSSFAAINDLHLETVTMKSIGDEVEQIWEKLKEQFPTSWKMTI